MRNKCSIGKDLEENSRDLIEVLYWNSPEWIEEKHKKLVKIACVPTRFEPSTSRLYIWSVTPRLLDRSLNSIG
jgi:hypothetical protein